MLAPLATRARGRDAGGEVLAVRPDPQRDLAELALRGHRRALGDLLGPMWPPGTDEAWSAWQDLHATRTQGPHTPNPISYGELLAYQATTDRPLTACEVACVRAADEAFLSELTRAIHPATDHGTED